MLDRYKLEAVGAKHIVLRSSARTEFTIPHKYGLDNGKFKAYRILLKSERRHTEAALTAVHHQRLDFMKQLSHLIVSIYYTLVYYRLRNN